MISPTVCTAANSQNRALSLLLPSSPTIQASTVRDSDLPVDSVMADPPPSQAGSLPQGFAFTMAVSFPWKYPDE